MICKCRHKYKQKHCIHVLTHTAIQYKAYLELYGRFQRGQFSISFIWNNFPLSCSKHRPELSEPFLFLFLLFNHSSVIHLPPFPKSLFHTSVFCYLLFLSLFSSSSSENSINSSFLLSTLYFSLFFSQTLLIFYNLVHLLSLSELYFRLVLHKGILEITVCVSVSVCLMQFLLGPKENMQIPFTSLQKHEINTGFVCPYSKGYPGFTAWHDKPDTRTCWQILTTAALTFDTLLNIEITNLAWLKTGPKSHVCVCFVQNNSEMLRYICHS